MSRTTGAFAALIASLLTSAAVLALPAAAQDPPLPAVDPFYSAPATKVAKAVPGKILRRREVSVTLNAPASEFESWQLLYRTTDTKRKPEATVATVLIPEGGPPPGGRKLLAYQPAEDSLTSRCSSSYELRTGTTQGSEISAALARGWVVVVPDSEGPHSQWAAGPKAGRAVLDAIRASERFRRAQLAGRRTQVGIWGYSGGGQASAWAAELQGRYAPELRIVGVAEGGVPPDLAATARNIDGGPFSGIYLAAAVGLSRAYPEIGIGSLLNDAGREMVAAIGEMCLEEFVTAYPLRRMREFTTVPDPLVLPQVQKVLGAVRLGNRTPVAPLYVYHAILDELNPIGPVDRMVDEYCRRGTTVAYVRDIASEHLSLVVSGAPGAIEFLEDRFAGVPPPSTC